MENNNRPNQTIQIPNVYGYRGPNGNPLGPGNHETSSRRR